MVTLREEAAAPARPHHRPHRHTDTILWSPRSACSGGCGIAECVLGRTSVVRVDIAVKYPSHFKTSLTPRARTH